MPKCKDDNKKYYKGTEPSPKGLGHCAHTMKEGNIKDGRDGNKWIIKKDKNGRLSWKKIISSFEQIKNSKKENFKKFSLFISKNLITIHWSNKKRYNYLRLNSKNLKLDDVNLDKKIITINYFGDWENNDSMKTTQKKVTLKIKYIDEKYAKKDYKKMEKILRK